MKLLTALAPAVLIVGLMGCSNYGSQYEAKRACTKWEENEDVVTYNFEERHLKKTLESGNRSCFDEAATRQVIGEEKVLDGQYDKSNTKFQWKTIKRFRY